MKSRIKEAYGDLCVSSQLHEKLMSIPDKKTAPQSRIVKIGTALVAAILITFCADMICYAVTGKGITERVSNVFSDDKSITNVEINDRQTQSFELSFDGKTIIINDDIYGQALIDTDGDAKSISIITEPELSVRVESGKVYLIIGTSGKIRKDITDDLQDGYANGIFIIDNKEYRYKVTGKDGEYEVGYE